MNMSVENTAVVLSIAKLRVTFAVYESSCHLLLPV